LVYYQPETVDLTGIVQVKTFPGPPNYYDIKKGDVPETCGYLILEHPIDVDLKPHVKDEFDGFDELERNVKIIQLVAHIHGHKDWDFIKTGKHVRVIGKLFHSFTGHHHAKILVMIDTISELKEPLVKRQTKARSA